MPQRLAAAAFAALLLAFAAGCGGPATPGVTGGAPTAGGSGTKADEAADAGILLYGNGTEPATLDPHIATGVTENHVISSLLEGLVAYGPDPATDPAPGMAERWESDPQQRVWTFHLREAKWSNGDPVRASDFVYAHQRILSAELGGQYADMLYLVEGAEAFHKGELKDFAQVGVKAVGDRTLVYRLRGPTPYFLSMLLHYSWFPVNPRVIEAHGGMTNRAASAAWTTLQNYVGNGPFKIAEWIPKSVLRVRRNPAYWDAANVKLNGIDYLAIVEASTEERAFASGELHVTNTMVPALIGDYLADRPEIIRIDPYLGTYFYRFNVNRAPLNDARVRRALTLTIDRERITKRITQGGQRQALGFTPDGMKGYETPQPLAFNPNEARRLLAEAGFPGGRGFPKFELLFNTSETHKQIAEAVQEGWKTELGIDVTLTNVEWNVYLDRQNKLDYQISRAAWIGDYLDPITFLSMWITDGGNNNTGWSNAEFDRLIVAAGAEAEAAKRFALLRQAEEILLRELPVAPVYWYTRVFLKHPRVRGWTTHPLDNRSFKLVHFAPAR